jgi:hypothetical protein
MKKTQFFSYLVLAIAALSLTSCMVTTGYTYRYASSTPVVTYVDPSCTPGYDNYSGGYSYSTRLSYNSSGSAGSYDYGTGTYCPSNPCNNHGHYHDPNGYFGPRKGISDNTPNAPRREQTNVQKNNSSSSPKADRGKVERKDTIKKNSIKKNNNVSRDTVNSKKNNNGNAKKKFVKYEYKSKRK